MRSSAFKRIRSRGSSEQNSNNESIQNACESSPFLDSATLPSVSFVQTDRVITESSSTHDNKHKDGGAEFFVPAMFFATGPGYREGFGTHDSAAVGSLFTTFWRRSGLYKFYQRLVRCRYSALEIASVGKIQNSLSTVNQARFQRSMATMEERMWAYGPMDHFLSEKKAFNSILNDILVLKSF